MKNRLCFGSKLDKMEKLVFVLVILHFSVLEGAAAVNCTTEEDCRCMHDGEGKYIADCSSKSLNFVPKFYSNVVAVDLSNNSITKFPEEGVFPETLVTLNFSKNKLVKFEQKSFSNLHSLRYLDLSLNELCLNNETYFPGLFKNLSSLESLVLKENCMASTVPHQYYPDDVFKDLVMLRNLSIDGFPNTKFGVGFSELNHLTYLDLSGFSGVCDLSYMSADFFAFLPHLESIDISDCKIMRIENGTFRYLKNLTNLDISFNEDLTFRVLSNVSYDLQSTKISVFRANKIHRTFGSGTEVFVKDLEYLQNTELKELYLDSNRIEIIESGVFKSLPKSLIYASLADNKFTMGLYMFEISAMTNIKFVNASFQHISHNPTELLPPPSKDSCDQQVRNQCPVYASSPSLNLKLLHNQNVLTPSKKNRKININPILFENKVSGPIMAPLPPNLETLYFRKCALRYSIPAIDFIANELKYCDFSENILFEWIGPIKKLTKLKHLDLSKNYCSNVSTSFFCCFEQLETLLIADNYLGFVLNNDIKGLTFGGLKSLKILNISLNRIQELQLNIFHGLTSLKHLNISNNALRHWTFEIRHMKELEYIDLSNNELTSVAKNIRNDLDEMIKKQNITLNLKNNNFLCNCDTLDFLEWMTSTTIKFQNFETYRCHNTETSTFQFKNLPDIIFNLNWECKWKWIPIIGGSILGSIVLVIIIYKKRWYFLKLYYITVIKRKQNRNQNRNRYRGNYESLDENNADCIYKYDVFFIYDDEDIEFVWKAVQKLQSRNVRVCFREYDFMAGATNIQCMCYALEKSEKVVVVLSKNLVDSEICEFQIDLALEERRCRGDSKMVLVLNYQNVPFKKLSLMFRYLNDNNLSIDFPVNDEDNGYFWDNLYEKIKSNAEDNDH